MKKPKMAYLADINYQDDRPSYNTTPPFKNKIKNKNKVKKKQKKRKVKKK